MHRGAKPQGRGSLSWQLPVALNFELQRTALVPVNRQGEKVPQADFFSLKAVLESALDSLGIRSQIEYKPLPLSDDARFHPTRSAAIYVAGEFVATLGQIHPGAAAAAGLEADTVLCEIAWDWVMNSVSPRDP